MKKNIEVIFIVILSLLTVLLFGGFRIASAMDFIGEFNTMYYTAGEPYSIHVDTNVPFGSNSQYFLTMSFGIGIDDNSTAWNPTYTTTFFGSYATQQVSFSVSDFPPGSLPLDDDNTVSFSLDIYPTQNGTNLSVDLRFFAPTTGYPATLGNLQLDIQAFAPSETLHALYFNYTTSADNATQFFTPVLSWNVLDGAEITRNNATFIPQAEEWYTQMSIDEGDTPYALRVYDTATNELVYKNDFTYTKSTWKETFIIFAEYQKIYTFQNYSAQLDFWKKLNSLAYSEGEAEGVNVGKEQGYSEGYADGYLQGQEDGSLENLTNPAKSLFAAILDIIDAPIFGGFKVSHLLTFIVVLGVVGFFIYIARGR